MRIALMTLTRLAAAGYEKTLAAMVDAGLPRIVRLRSAQAWSDEDVPELLEGLDEALSTSVATLSSIEKYRSEVLSGSLDWTPMHMSRPFWAVRSLARLPSPRQLLCAVLTLSPEELSLLA
jgi:V-type H+-transporting ATPase subunit H